MIGGIIGGIGSMIQAGANNKINQENLNLQKQTLNYQMNRDLLQMQRDDSSLQRKMADAQQAGINPLAALGATGQVTSPQPVVQAPQRGNLETNPLEGLDMANTVMGLMMGKANLDQTRAQTEAIRANTYKTRRHSEVYDKNIKKYGEGVTDGIDYKQNVGHKFPQIMGDMINNVIKNIKDANQFTKEQYDKKHAHKKTRQKKYTPKGNSYYVNTTESPNNSNMISSY